MLFRTVAIFSSFITCRKHSISPPPSNQRTIFTGQCPGHVMPSPLKCRDQKKCFHHTFARHLYMDMFDEPLYRNLLAMLEFSCFHHQLLASHLGLCNPRGRGNAATDKHLGLTCVFFLLLLLHQNLQPNTRQPVQRLFTKWSESSSPMLHLSLFFLGTKENVGQDAPSSLPPSLHPPADSVAQRAVLGSAGWRLGVRRGGGNNTC